ncbi:MAG: hypothetical protein U5K36_03650 [Roseovarius sp.]|nr:hypothetical protein [Roseovarius sp.]
MDDRKPPSDLLDWMGIKGAPDWRVTRVLGPGVAVFIALLIAGAYVAAFAIVYRVVFGGGAASLGTGALIAALLGAPFVIWGTVLRHQTLRYQKEGHITDRITSAVEQLGAEKTVKTGGEETTAPNIEVRIGAILSLERIAQDSTMHDKGRDHVRVMEILCAYVRENSNARRPVDFPLPEWEPLADDADEEARKEHAAWRVVRFANLFNSNVQQWAQSLPMPRADIAVALQVLGRRTAEQRLVEAAWPEAPEATTVWPFDTPCPELRKGTDDAPLTGTEISAFKEKLEAWQSTVRNYSGYRIDLRDANLQRVRPHGQTSRRLRRGVFRRALARGADRGGRHSSRCGWRVLNSSARGWKGPSSYGRGWRGRSSTEREWRGRTSDGR